MTISSALAGYAKGEQRQISAAAGTDPKAANAVPALQAGPWSAIDWEFGSVLQALMPDGTEAPVKPGAAGETVDSSQAAGVQTPFPKTLGGLPFAPGLNRELRALVQQSGAQTVASSIPVKPPTGALNKAADAVKTVAPDPATVQTPDAQPQEPNAGVLQNVLQGKLVPRILVRTPDSPPTVRPDSPSPNGSVVSQPKDPKSSSAPASSAIPTLPPSPPLPPEIRLAPQPKDAQGNAAPVKENTVEAEVVGAPTPLASGIVPTFPPSPPLPQNIRLDSQLKDTRSNSAPAKENTLEAEVVGAPAPRTSGPVPTFPPSPLPPNSQPKNAGSNLVPVKENAPAGATDIRTSDIAPTLRSSVLPESQPVRTSDSAPTLPPSPLPLPIRAESEQVSVKTAPTPDAKPTPRIEPRPKESTIPVQEPVTEATAILPASAPVPGSVPQIAFNLPAKEIKSEPALVQRTPIPVPTVSAQPALEKTPSSVKVERNQRQADPESRPEPAKNSSGVVEPPTPPIPAPETTPKPVATIAKTSTDSAQKVTAPSDDEPLPAPALTDSKESAPPSANPIVIAPVLSGVPAVAPTPHPIAPEKRSDDPSKSQPAGLIAVQESKPERTPAEGTPAPPAPPAGKQPTDPGQFSIAESKTKGDQPSPNDTEIAFTGRLVPRQAAEEPVSRPDSVDSKLEKVSEAPARVVQDAPVERQVRPPAEAEPVRPAPRTEPGIIVSAVHRDVAPAGPDRPTEPLPSARNAGSENIQEPVNSESSGPVHEISMRFNDQSQDSAHLRVVEKDGEVSVSVRSGSEQLARTLSSDLGDLTHRLEQSGFQAELYRPAAQSSSNQPGQDRRDNASTADQNPSQSWARGGKDSQDHPGQKAREWMDDLEESMGQSH